MGLTESSLSSILKPFTFLTHCKVNCNSPCCQSLCGDDNHCQCNIDTTADYTSSDEDDDQADVGQVRKQGGTTIET